MNTILWIFQGLLAAMFTMAGITKSTQPKEKLEKQFPWVKDFSLNTVRFIGLSELLGAIGLIVPWLTGILPVLTPVAALGLCLIMVLAALLRSSLSSIVQAKSTILCTFRPYSGRTSFLRVVL